MTAGNQSAVEKLPLEGDFAGNIANSDLITVEMPILRAAAQSGIVNLVYGVVP